LQLAPITGLADQWPWLLLAAALATLAAACADVLRGWWRRRQSWLAAPAAAAEISRPVHGLAAAEIVIGALLLGSLLVAPQAAVLPLALALAALGVLTTAHRLGSAALGEFGLVLVAGATLAAGRAWGSPTLRGWLFGALLAAIHMLWLARFWQQQLHQGCAWTSAGRLIPAARRVCLALTALAVAVCTYELLNRSTVDAAPRGILDVWIALALLVLTSLLVRDAASGGEGSAGFACLAALALTARLTELPGVDIAQPPLLVLVAAAVSLLALRVALARETGPDQPVYNALVGGVLPALLTASALHRGIDSVWLGSAILAVGAWMLGTLRSRRDPRGIDHTITAGQV
ncbi:MAG: hypothetical protein HXY23_13990, partial [Parvularculaceae bacterium]|nr:hypothetical protein [Parvularculaceae bacterium]